MQVIVDRIEGEYLVLELEDGSIIDVKRELIPGAKEGDIVDIYINEEATKERCNEVRQLMDDLFVD